MNIKRGLILLLGLVLLWSAINPVDYFKWFTGVLPALIGFTIIFLFWNRFKFTNCTFYFITLYSAVLMIGAHYTYHKVPFFSSIADGVHIHYFENLVHFLQGFVPAIIVREVLVRGQVLNKDRWMTFITICICVTISVSYELVEWFIKEISATAANVVWENNVYHWDTEPNLLLATMGATISLILISRIQDRAIRNFKRKKIRVRSLELDPSVTGNPSGNLPENES